MILLVCFLMHGVICSIAVADIAARAMTLRARLWWLGVVLLTPGIGAAAYAVWVLRFDRGRNGSGGGVE
ncbi:MAG: hypothetical protein QM783_16100 [Phycisphaerales bacterium]